MSVAWSYSALTAFEGCPRRFYHTRVKKDVSDPPGEEAKWGQRVHKHLEDRINIKAELPDELQKLEPLCSKMESAPGDTVAEIKYCLTSSYRPTGYFAKDAWLRVVVDVKKKNGVNVGAFDWKTGKRKPESEQLRLTAATIMAAEPEVEKVTTGFIWLKDNKIDKETFTRDQVPEIWQEFLSRVRRMEIAHEDNKWEAKPSGLCKAWCPVTSCSFNGRRK